MEVAFDENETADSPTPPTTTDETVPPSTSAPVGETVQETVPTVENADDKDQTVDGRPVESTLEAAAETVEEVSKQDDTGHTTPERQEDDKVSIIVTHHPCDSCSQHL